MPKMPRVENQWKAERERLAGELQRLEEALSEARTGSGDHDDGSLVSKLREATKKRVRIEEEFERSSDRWRDERRNLTEEIDQLDRALAKARADARQKQSASKSDDSELQRELERTHEARQKVEERLEQERVEWDDARRALEAKIGKLETSLVDALERANNSASSDEALQSTLKARLETQRKAVEEEVQLRFEASLEQTQQTLQALEDERARLHLEIHRLKEAAQKAPLPATPPAPAPARTSRFSLKKLRMGKADETAATAPDPAPDRRILDLEKRLAEQTALHKTVLDRAQTAEARLAELEAQQVDGVSRTPDPAIEADFEARAAAWDAERKQLNQKVKSLEEELDHAVRAAPPASSDPNADAEARIADALAAQAARWESDRRALETEIEELRSLEAASSTAETADDAAELAALRADALAWNGERAAQEARTAELGQFLIEANEKTAAAERALQDLRAETGTRETSWDTERQDLTARIAALEASLQEAESLSSGHRDQVQALEERIRASEESLAGAESRRQVEDADWTREREALTARVGELEFALTDAQSGQADITHQYEQLQVEFEEARRAGNELREQMGVDVREWSDEQKALNEQVRELTASLAEARNADASADAKTKQLVAELGAAEQKLAQAASEWKSERKQLEAGVRELERSLKDHQIAAEAERERAEAEIEALRQAHQDAVSELEAVRTELGTSSAEWEETRLALETRTAELEQAIGDLHTAAETAEAALRERFESEKLELTTSRDSLASKVGDLEADNAAFQDRNQALDDRIKELEGGLEATGLRAEQDAAALQEALDESRSAYAVLREEAEARAIEWNAERTERESEVASLTEEIRKLRRALSEGKSLTAGRSTGGATSVADLEARRQALEVRLLESEDAKEELATTLQSATDEWESERRRLQQQLEEMDHAIESASRKEKGELDARHAELQEKLQEVERKYLSLEDSSLTAAKAWDEQRAQLEQEIAQWEQQVVSEAERVAEETKKALQEEYDMQLRELRSQKEQLEAQLHSNSGSMPGAGADPAAIHEEMARVDAEIDEINQLIEDPNAALSNVMRKNAERSELKAYRRGLSYLAERLANESPKES